MFLSEGSVYTFSNLHIIKKDRLESQAVWDSIQRLFYLGHYPQVSR